MEDHFVASFQRASAKWYDFARIVFLTCPSCTRLIRPFLIARTFNVLNNKTATDRDAPSDNQVKAFHDTLSQEGPSDKTPQMSKLLATATQKLWKAMAVRCESVSEVIDLEYYYKSLGLLAQISSVCDLLGGHAKVKEYMNNLKGAATATREILTSFKGVSAMMEKDPDAKLRPAILRAAAATDKRPKHDTVEDFSLEDDVHKAYVTAYEKIVDAADSGIVGNLPKMVQAASKLDSLELDKVEKVVSDLEPYFSGASKAGTSWFDGFVPAADGSTMEVTKKTFIAHFNKTLGKWVDKDTKSHSEKYQEASKVSFFSVRVVFRRVGPEQLQTRGSDLGRQAAAPQQALCRLPVGCRGGT